MIAFLPYQYFLALSGRNTSSKTTRQNTMISTCAIVIISLLFLQKLAFSAAIR